MTTSAGPSNGRPGHRRDVPESETSPEVDDDHSSDHDDIEAALARDDGTLGLRLQALLDPPSDIGAQTTRGVDRELRERSNFNMGMDLMGLGWTTLKLLLVGGPGENLMDCPVDADRENEGT